MKKILKVLTHIFDSMPDLLQKLSSLTTSQVDKVEESDSFQKACIKKILKLFLVTNYNVRK